MIDKIVISYNAKQTRAKLGVDNESPVDVFALLEGQNNITTVFLPLSENISGLCIPDDNNQFIGINSTMSKGRQQYTAAHELCHLEYHKGSGCFLCNKSFDGKKDEQEKEADVFASYFLAPYDALHDYFEKVKTQTKQEITIQDIIACENFFGMSHLAMLIRLKEEAIITPRFYEECKMESPSAIARKMGFSTDLYYPSMNEEERLTTGKYIRMVNEVNQKELISESMYESLLRDAFRDATEYENGGKVDID